MKATLNPDHIMIAVVIIFNRDMKKEIKSFLDKAGIPS
jgi:hypothetical protein